MPSRIRVPSHHTLTQRSTWKIWECFGLYTNEGRRFHIEFIYPAPKAQRSAQRLFELSEKVFHKI